MMIRALIESAFKTGYLSVESEGLLYQVLTAKSYRPDELTALAQLYDAVQSGKIKREAASSRLLNWSIWNIHKICRT